MKDITSTSSSRLVTVRLDAPVREQLDSLASASDRTLAQLARYALTAYFDNEISPIPAPLDEGASNTRKHVSLRIPSGLSDTLDKYSQGKGVTASDVLRHALAWWLENADTAHLGMPGSVAGSEVSS